MTSRPKKPVEVVVFNNPWKGKNKSGPGSQVNKVQSDTGPGVSRTAPERPVFDQKKAKYDIRKLGIHGMGKRDKQNAMADLLVELGAKPKRKRRIPIKEYQEIRLKNPDTEAPNPIPDDGEKKKKTKEKRKRAKDDILNYVDGQAGFFKNGVQFMKKSKR